MKKTRKFMEYKKNKFIVKANTPHSKKLILKKEYIIKSNSTLVLKNEFLKKINNKVKVLKDNIFDINNINQDIVLSAKNISKNLSDKPILKNISLHLKQGQILGLLGPNGSGKSTMFNILIGKLIPDFGIIKLFNKNITNYPIHQRANEGISLLEQNKGLFGKMTAYENLYSVLELYINDKDKIEKKINTYLSYFGLNYLLNVKANNMSGGEYKKISILQRICNKNVKILLLDEPMAALDPLSISSLKKFILELKNSGLSIILSDHNFFAIYDILDNCIIIRDGQVMIEDKPKMVIKNEQAIKFYLGSGFKV